MQYYRVKEGHELWHPDGSLLGKGGDIVSLDTDSDDKPTRKAALAVLNGNWSMVSEVSKPERVSKKKASNKKASYETKDATPEG